MVNVKKSGRISQFGMEKAINFYSKYGQETTLKRGAYNGAGFENSKKICEFL